MESKQTDPSQESFHLFDDKNPVGFSFGFFDSTEKKPLPPPPPRIEVFSSKAAENLKFKLEQVNFDGFTLLKGRVSTHEVFGLSNSDLVPGKYEGGLKLWEGSLDLVKALRSEINHGDLSFSGKRVLELGCGHGLPGIFACLMGASTVHFQDFNVEVLERLTIPNVNVNIQEKTQPEKRDVPSHNFDAEIRYFAGDWSELHHILPHANTDESDPSNDKAHEKNPGYDVILMAETVYSMPTLPGLYKLIKKCLRSPHGLVYMAAKKYYFGVGGGSRRFLSIVEKNGILASDLVAEVADGSSNVREVWKFYLKS